MCILEGKYHLQWRTYTYYTLRLHFFKRNILARGKCERADRSLRALPRMIRNALFDATHDIPNAPWNLLSFTRVYFVNFLIVSLKLVIFTALVKTLPPDLRDDPPSTHDCCACCFLTAAAAKAGGPSSIPAVRLIPNNRTPFIMGNFANMAILHNTTFRPDVTGSK